MKQASVVVSIKTALFGVVLTLAACSSPNRVSEAAELLITVQNGEAVVTPVLEGDVLWLGQTRIEPWLGSAPDCSACQLRIERRHSPVGPDLVLSLYQGDQLRWRLIDSRQLKLRLPDNSLIEHQGSNVRWSQGEESIDLKESETLTWQGCRQHLAWLAKPAVGSSKNIVPEASVTRWQLITNCS